MKTIDNDIKRQEFKKIYLLYGEERYLIRQYREKLKAALTTPDDTMNFSAFEGEDINVKEKAKTFKDKATEKWYTFRNYAKGVCDR